MSSNIYEDPTLTVNVGYSKAAREAGAEQEEQVVDIYESEDAGRRVWTFNRVSEAERKQHGERKTCSRGQAAGFETRSLQQGLSLNGPPSVHRNLVGAAALVLGLICLLLVAAVIFLSRLYTLEKDRLQSQIKQLSNQTNLTKGFSPGNNTGWTMRGYYYISTEKKNWTESRKDCQSRGADLVVIDNREEQTFISRLSERGDAWIGLRAVKKHQWEQKLEWEWVDGTTPGHLAWGRGVTVNPANNSTAFLDTQGVWNYTVDGSKFWICEK